MATTAERLAEVQAAMTAIMTTGQSYTFDGQSITRANMLDLKEMEQLLERRLAKENGRRARQSTADFRYPV